MEPIQPPDDADFDNPYAPPRSAFETEPTVHLRSLSIPFSIDSILNASWSIFRDNLGTCLWVVWSVMLVNFGLAFALNALQAGLQAAMPGDQMSIQFIYWTFYFVSLILQAWLGIGMNLLLIKIVRGEQVSFDQLFSGGRYLLKVILAGIVMFVMFFGAVLVPVFFASVGFAALRNQPVAGILILVVCIVLLVFLMIYVGARLLQFYFLIIDRDAGVIESIQLAWQITRGKAGTIILVYLMQFVLAVLGILALCVGLVFTIPLSNLLLVVTYLALVGPAKSPERMPFSSWE
jgi:uncharacterized membrane protein